MIALVALWEEHPAEFERELLSVGLRWRDVGTKRCGWEDVASIIRSTPPGSPLYTAIHGADSLWTLTDMLLALTVDVLRGANYQRGGGKGAKPKPLPRPGVKKDKSSDSKTYGTPLPASEIVERIRRRTGISPV